MMHLSIRGKGLVFSALLMAVLPACGRSLTSQSAQPSVPTIPAAQDYQQSLALTPTHTNEALDLSKTNHATLKGTGPSSTYRVLYHFNAGSSKYFSLLGLDAETSGYGCTSMPSAQAALEETGSSTPQQIAVGTKYSLVAGHDYVLAIEQPQNCDTVEVNLDLVAWIGDKDSESPAVARSCTGQGGEELTFFDDDGATEYSPAQPGKPFVGSQEFCGETFAQYPIRIESSGDTPHGFSSRNAYTAGPQGNQRAYEVDFDTSGSSGSMSCTTNGTKTHAENFSKCQDAVLDQNTFKSSKLGT
jgi:hypothetical protein